MTTEYRYRLTRGGDLWGDNMLLVCMMNPSTATEDVDDPTIRRVMGFARRDGFSRVEVVNLFAARATNPKDLLRMSEPVGVHNDGVIINAASRCDKVVAAWGAVPVMAKSRARMVMSILRRFRDVHRWGEATKDGHPRHPLYLPKDAPLQLHVRRWGLDKGAAAGSPAQLPGGEATDGAARPPAPALT